MSSKIKSYYRDVVTIEGYCLNPKDLEFIASWCGGQIKGIKLPREKQCIDIQTKNGEIRAEMGNRIFKLNGTYYIERGERSK